jgi:pimeloyl-ACP methyl ester carboxylesterase
MSQLVATFGATPVHLVGHSYAGMVMASVAAQRPNVVGCIYVDAFVPAAGECGFDLLGPLGDHLKTSASADPSRCFAPPPAEMFGVDNADVAALLAQRLVPMPMETHIEVPPTAAVGRDDADRWSSSFIRCTRFEGFAAAQQRAEAAGWAVVELDADHEVMLTNPARLAEALVSILM